MESKNKGPTLPLLISLKGIFWLLTFDYVVCL